MAKCDPNYIHPFDAKLYDIGQAISPRLNKDFGVTPNALTYASYGASIAAAIFIAQKRFWLASLCIILSWVFDNWDGAMARTLQLCTPYGDFLDHYSDWAGAALYIFALIRIDFAKYFSNGQLLFLAVVTLLILIALLIHSSCEVKYLKQLYSSSSSLSCQAPSLDGVDKACRTEEPTKVLQFSRWGGYFTMHVLTIGLLVVLAMKQKVK